MSTPKVGNKAKARRSAKNKRTGKYVTQRRRTERNKLIRRINRQKKLEAKQ